MARELRATRYLRAGNEALARFIVNDLHRLDFATTMEFYDTFVAGNTNPTDFALLGANDRYFLLVETLNRLDAVHPWLFARTREVEAAPDGYLDLWAREHYKFLRLSEPVVTPNGWKNHGDLIPGDEIFGPDGNICRVIALNTIVNDAECYEIEFDDGFKIKAGAEHLWPIERRTRKRIPGAYNKDGPKRLYRETVIMPTAEIAAHDHRQDNRLAIRVNDPLDLPDAALPIDPYLLGAWLGDGTSKNGNITCGDPEIFDQIRAAGYELGPDKSPKRNAAVRRVVGLRQDLSALGIRGKGLKAIPPIYLRASKAQRLALLQGLMDTDGHCNTRGTATFVNINDRLVDDFTELCHTLGLKPRRRRHIGKHNGEPYPFWQVSFQAYEALPPFRLTRKLARCKKGPRPNPRRYIVSCRRVDPEPMRCIQVDRPDGLYLAGTAMVTTHNSTIITFAGTIQEVAVDPEITTGIFSFTAKIARKFVKQIMVELETNAKLKARYPDVFWADPKREAPLWSLDEGIIVNRRTNPKEATVEGHGLVDAQPTSKHFRLMVYDDVIERRSVTNPDMINKVTEGWELSDNLGAGDVRKWHAGTRYLFGDTYGILIERELLIPRLYPATHNGRLDGKPVFFSKEKWEKKKKAQRSTIAAQMLQNPAAGNEAMFKMEWLTGWIIRPTTLNVYIMGDPSAGLRKKDSDNTAIAVIGMDANGNKYLLDGACHKMQLSEKWAMLSRLRKKWVNAPGIITVDVGWERYGQEADQQYFEEKMMETGVSFSIRELSWTRDGTVSKEDRVGRLQPAFADASFFVPGIVYHDGLNIETSWKINLDLNRIDYEPIKGPTRAMRAATALKQDFLIAKPIRRQDEEGRVYDLTRRFFEEYLFFPFSTKKDLIDVTSRIYDMDPVRPAVYESQPEDYLPAYHDA